MPIHPLTLHDKVYQVDRHIVQRTPLEKEIKRYSILAPPEAHPICSNAEGGSSGITTLADLKHRYYQFRLSEVLFHSNTTVQERESAKAFPRLPSQATTSHERRVNLPSFIESHNIYKMDLSDNENPSLAFLSGSFVHIFSQLNRNERDISYDTYRLPREFASYEKGGIRWIPGRACLLSIFENHKGCFINVSNLTYSSKDRLRVQKVLFVMQTSFLLEGVQFTGAFELLERQQLTVVIGGKGELRLAFLENDTIDPESIVIPLPVGAENESIVQIFKGPNPNKICVKTDAHKLYVINIEEKSSAFKIEIPFWKEFSECSWHPENENIVVLGEKEGLGRIFLWNIARGEPAYDSLENCLVTTHSDILGLDWVYPNTLISSQGERRSIDNRLFNQNVCQWNVDRNRSLSILRSPTFVLEKELLASNQGEFVMRNAKGSLVLVDRNLSTSANVFSMRPPYREEERDPLEDESQLMIFR